MFKKIMYFVLLAGVGYGIYYLCSKFPLESVIVIGILASALIVRWITQAESEK